MPLAPGHRLGPYEILAPLGAGGMGEVYRARDARLGRDVAVKVLPTHLSASPEVRARFEREARTVSALNHPNICTLFDVGREAGVDYLVMELVEGETLADRIARGALPVAETLRLGGQIADALDRAHRAGVIHRDLKPGNVMLAKSGAKLMDFGLARATGLAASAGDLTRSPTVTRPLTAEGTIVGTFQYMAPEQLEGRETDARGDLWALGCVLYEMATGRRAFDGPTQASLISAIMRDEPRPMAELAPLSPPALDRAVRQCLAKDADERWQSAGDLRRELAWIAGSTSQGAAPLALPRRRRAPGWPVALVAGALLASAAWLALGPRGGGDVLQLSVTHDAGGHISGELSDASISPDGRRIAYLTADSTSASLWVRRLDRREPLRLATSSTGMRTPFWSPDSRTVAYFTEGEDGRLWKVPADGGEPSSLCRASSGRGGTWSRDGVIVMAPASGGPLYRVSARGGDPEPATALDSTRHENAHRMPCFLPDGDHFLYSALPQSQNGYQICVGSLRTRRSRPLFVLPSGVTYVEPGYLLYRSEDKLVARRFDAGALRWAGDPVPLGDTPQPGTVSATRVATASRNGTLLCTDLRLPLTRLEWEDREGRATGSLAVPPGNYFQVAIAPDGRSVLLSRMRQSGGMDVWYSDPERGAAVRVTPDGVASYSAIWAPDGRSFFFCSNRTGREEIYRQSVDRPDSTELIPTTAHQFKHPLDVSPDGRTLLFTVLDPQTGSDLWSVPLDPVGPPVPLLRSPANEAIGAFSPDGRWLAAISDVSGRNELYVCPVDHPGRQRLIPTGGAEAMVWTSGGREILFVRQAPGGTLAGAVRLTPGPELRPEPPRPLFTKSGVVDGAITKDGTRLLASIQEEHPAPTTLRVILNWPRLLQSR